MDFIGIIPARYGSTRLPGKPLLEIAGKTMIQWVYERAREAVDQLWVATDHPDIFSTVHGFGGQAVMTSEAHSTGSSRCLEAYEKIRDLGRAIPGTIINIQGDEPLLHPGQLEALKQCFRVPDTEFATLVVAVEEAEELENESEVFVTFDCHYRALYFSRSVIPAVRGAERSRWLEYGPYYKHLGIYAYNYEALRKFNSLPPTRLETLEGLEQNRWLEHGYPIRIGITGHHSIPVDTEEDLLKVRKLLLSSNQ
jgi:3-deoxy-manno-octulosonate cytidylyltransferase (CMP-KDO synthetase)